MIPLLIFSFFSSLLQISIKNREVTPQVIAVSIEEIKKFGITTPGRDQCNDNSKVSIYESPRTIIEIDSIATNSFVNYERLSEIRKKPYWAPRRIHQLEDGEKFKLNSARSSGWLKARNLMTFTSGWRDDIVENLLKRNMNTVVCLYASGQFETIHCSALTVWHRTWPENFWILKTIEIQPLPSSKYTFPKIDNLLAFDNESLAIQLSASGGDAENRWGTYSFYLFHDNELSRAFTRNYDFRIDENYSTIECFLKLTESKALVAAVIEKHFETEGEWDSSSYRKVHTRTDTTLINLLDQIKN